MPKPLKKARPKDVNQIAHSAVAHVIALAEDRPNPKPPKGLSEYMASIGRRGGIVGGKKRLETMTKEERGQAAYRAARARWDRVAKEQS